MKTHSGLMIMLLIAVSAFLLTKCGKHVKNAGLAGEQNTWEEYLGGPARDHYSTLDQIDTANVGQLDVAWIYHTRDTGEMQCNPIIIDSILYGMTARTVPFAVHAATGKEIWKVTDTTGFVAYNMSRGVSYWDDGDDRRIFYTKGPWLYALDALTGQGIHSFGEKGRVSLKSGLYPTAQEKFVVSTSPGTIFKDLIIMPLRVSEDPDAAIGDIQAFDVRTGKLRWVFHTVPLPGEFGYETWPPGAYKNFEIGGANNWPGMAIDRERGIVYVPTGSAAVDYYGGNRDGKNLFANCLLALDAATGERLWHFQIVHHDILDRDPPAPPNLLTIERNGKRIDAVAQVTKHGLIFVFDRVTGEPLFPIAEREVPLSWIPGEHSWMTQPFPEKPLPFARQHLTERDLNPFSEDREELRKIFRNSRVGTPFTPLSLSGTLVFPGLDGGAEWGGAAVDPAGVIYINSNEMAWHLALGKAGEGGANKKEKAFGRGVYDDFCAACHGQELKGNPQMNIASLVDIGNRRSTEYIRAIIRGGKGMMPSFPSLPDSSVNTLLSYLTGKKVKQTGQKKEAGQQESPEFPFPYKVSLFSKFLDSRGLPGISPPWGTLNAIDLSTGEYLWKIPFGTYPELVQQGLDYTGAESYGGPVVTGGGLLLIAGTKDRKFRAYNKRTGDLLWETALPAAGFATPSTYAVGGRQYVVVACGGTKLGAPPGDVYIAFALTESSGDHQGP